MRRTDALLVACLLLLTSTGAVGQPTVDGGDVTLSASRGPSDGSLQISLLSGGDGVNSPATLATETVDVRLVPRRDGEFVVGSAAMLVVNRTDHGDLLGPRVSLSRPTGSLTAANATSAVDSDADALRVVSGTGAETGPADPDSDSDGIPIWRERLLDTDPTAADTDADGIADGREIDLGTDPTVADTDGDGLPDGREVRTGTDPTVPDTDEDGLADGREVDLGTDPTVADTDGDNLLDGWEVRGATPAGARLPGADPLAKDLYVQVDYAPGAEPPGPEFYAALRAAFVQMPVDNPDQTTGIDLHVREGGAMNESVTFSGENFWSLRDSYYDERLGPRVGVYHHVVVGEFATDQVGYGEVGGEFSMVAAGADNATRRHVVVHELLHNVVGHVDGPGACEDDPEHYCDGGWLSPAITPGEDEYLPPPLATELEREGFAD